MPPFLFLQPVLPFLQIKRTLPKVNRGIYKRLLEDEEAEINRKDADDADIKKKSKKKKGLPAEVMKDDRFGGIFKNPVLHASIILSSIDILKLLKPIK